MVGGYVLFSIPAIMLNPGFESGTKVPGLYEKAFNAFKTGKLPIFSVDGTIVAVSGISPLAGEITKAADGSYVLKASDFTFIVDTGDTVTFS